MFRLLAAACLLAAHLLRSQGSPSGSLPDELVGDEDEDMNLLRAEFEEFKVTYNKNYDGAEEEENRFQIFVKNLEKARKWQEEDRGTAEYGVNKFSDMSDEEFDRFYHNPMMMNNSSWLQGTDWKPDDEPMANRSLPTNWDWRNYRAVTLPKNQGLCNSCWAFAVIANVETLWYLKTGRLISMSEQELIDCDNYDRGCYGGYPNVALNSLIRLGGVMSNWNYPYMGRKGRCRFRRYSCVANIRSVWRIPPNEYEIAKWVAMRGPVIVGINDVAIKSYVRGIIRPNSYNCPGRVQNHAVTIVGYGVARNIPYWSVKNSWGRNWGEQGFFRITRGDMACGINRYPLSAIV